MALLCLEVRNMKLAFVHPSLRFGITYLFDNICYIFRKFMTWSVDLLN